MRLYLVGGAVRDQLLERPVHERDWLVIGASAAKLISLGFRPVGKDFRVFLHPDTNEEYALPRITGSALDERDLVEQDLRHRDLTINALAISPEGHMLDPLGGAADLKAGLLRHTPAFTQDPHRVLRLARFAARYTGRGFRVAAETSALVQRMVARDELSNLTPERVWGELHKALADNRPWVFFQTLRELGALRVVLPELDRLFGVPQPKQHHPEIDTGIHSLLTLKQACRLSDATEVRFAALLHDLGKGLSPPELWPGHVGHESRGADLVDRLCQRLRVPNRHRILAEQVARYHTDCHRAFELKPRTLLQRLRSLNALRRPQQLEYFLSACHADLCGRPGFENRPYPQAAFFRAARDAALTVDTTAIAQESRNKQRVAQRVERARCRAIGNIDGRRFQR